jgi:glyoxylase-like metal-dependent hydrolase (beta-lactamase superfamily II)
MIIKKINDRVTAASMRSGGLPLYRLDVWLYIVDGVLIDTGSSHTSNDVKSLLRQEKIHCAAITHIHEDHTGGAAWIKKNLKIPVYLPASAIDEAASKTNLPLYRKLVWGNRDGFVADPMPAFIETEKFRLDVIATPGHNKDHVAFYEKNKGWLFSGDMYISRKQQVALFDENIGDAIKTLKKIAELDIDKIFCGHSGVQDKGKEKLQAKLDYFLELQNRVTSLRKEGLSMEEIDNRLFPKRNLWAFFSGGEWSTLNIIKTITAQDSA